MTNQTDDPTADKPISAPPATQRSSPDRELELKLKKNPEDLDSKTDVGSDESMDASDPIASNQPGGNEPAPSSSFPEEK